MECNKEEAIRAKEIAERKMQSKDFVGARKIVLKAQQLFPELENISQMLIVCDVHCSSVAKISGSELDWYGILQIEQTADEASIKKQYRKLALQLHPDKNKFAGAEAAFKLIGEAHRVLTDQAKRSMYDMKRRVNVRTTGTRQAPPHMNKNSHARKQSNNQNKFTNDTSSQFPGMNQQQTQATTFWTSCPFCGIRYQYYQSIMNRALRCQNCQKPFIAYDINAQGTQLGANHGHGWKQSEIPQQKEVPSQSTSKVNPRGTAGNSSSSAGSSRTTMPESISKTENHSEFGGRSTSKAAEDGYAAERRAKYEEEKLEEVNKRAQSHKRRRRMVLDESSESCDTDSTDEDEVVAEDDLLAGQTVETTSSRYPRRSTRQKQHVTYNENGSDDDDFVKPPSSKKPRGRGLSGQPDDQRKHNEEFEEEDANKKGEPACEMPIFEDKKKDKQKDGIPSEESLPNGEEISETYKKNGKHQAEVSKKEESSKDEESSDEHSTVNLDCKTQSNLESMTYAEPEFNDFDKNRTESHFAVDQIWAAYDTNGCMPRYYARIRKIVSKQSTVGVTWLEPVPDPDDQDEVNWVKKDFPFACGNFTLGDKSDVDFSSFSHLVSWEKVKGRGTYKIYPRKGDIWALFKDWDIKWSSDLDMHRYKFEVVEVLSDYDEESGLKVARLVKLKGFISLFRQTRNKEMDSFQIPRNELLRFSHRIPYYRMTGRERQDVLEGSYELDPASLPNDIEEVEFVPSKGFGDAAVDIDSMEAQGNGSCSKSASEYQKHKKPKKCIEPNEKNIHERDNVDNKGPSSRVTNGTCEKKQKPIDSGKGNRDGFRDSKEGKANVIKCQPEKEKHLNNAKSGPVYDATHDDSSSVESAGENFEYPDPEFYCFEEDKSEDKFQPGQIWALYSDMDSLPKFYGQINKVASKYFQVEITWLEVCHPLEEEIRWSEKTLPMGCGKFLVTRQTETYNTTQMFSHHVQADIISKGRYNIYPKVGEIWAVYKNLSVDWTCSDLENCEHDIVRVLSTTGPELRALILEKVHGYNSVFKDTGCVMMIPQKELLRFSHQIPAFRLTEERGGKLRGYLELDPAAVPPILFCTTSN